MNTYKEDLLTRINIEKSDILTRIRLEQPTKVTYNLSNGMATVILIGGIVGMCLIMFT